LEWQLVNFDEKTKSHFVELFELKSPLLVEKVLLESRVHSKLGSDSPRSLGFVHWEVGSPRLQCANQTKPVRDGPSPDAIFCFPESSLTSDFARERHRRAQIRLAEQVTSRLSHRNTPGNECCPFGRAEIGRLTATNPSEIRLKYLPVTTMISSYATPPESR